MKRARSRLPRQITEDVRSLVEGVLQACAGDRELSAAMQDKVSDLLEEVEGMGQDDESQASEERCLSRLKTYSQALRNAARAGNSAPSETKATQTQATSAPPRSAKRAAAPPLTKRPRSEDSLSEASAAPSSPGFGPPSSPGFGPATPTGPVPSSVMSLMPPPPAPATLGLSLTEPDMVRIATDLVFAIMRRAQTSSLHIRSLSEMFVEADSSHDGGISFVELLGWVKSLGVEVSDWQLDEFGKRLNWDQVCNSHPNNFIDEKGFYSIIRGVWNKVKWYFSNAVVYGVSRTDTEKKRHKEVMAIMEEIREPMQRLIQCLVVRSCHVHSFFAMFDQERAQKMGAGDLAKIFAMMGDIIGVKGDEQAGELSMKCCLIANYFSSGNKQAPKEGVKFGESDGTLRRGETFHYAAMCALADGKMEKTLSSLGADSGEGDSLTRTFTSIMPVDGMPDDDVRMQRSLSHTRQGITHTLNTLSITLCQLQDLVLEVFNEFTIRMELNVLSEESRDKLVFRHLFFGVCGVFESHQELQPIANIFTLFAKYSEKEKGLLHPYGFQQLLKNEFAITVTEKEVIGLLSLGGVGQGSLLAISELADLLRLAHREIQLSVKQRFPSTYTTLNLAQSVATLEGKGGGAEVIHIFVKVIMKVLHTDETFSEFFESLPKFRPGDMSFGSSVEETRYPDEIVMGLRRLGILSTPSLFEGLGKHGEGWTGTCWGPAPSYISKQQFLDLIWATYTTYVERAFKTALDFETEAREVAQKARSALFTLVAGRAAGSVSVADQVASVWKDLNPSGGPAVTVSHFLALLGVAEGETELVEPVHTLASRATLLRATATHSGLVNGMKQLLLQLNVPLDSQLSKEQVLQILSG